MRKYGSLCAVKHPLQKNSRVRLHCEKKHVQNQAYNRQITIAKIRNRSGVYNILHFLKHKVIKLVTIKIIG